MATGIIYVMTTVVTGLIKIGKTGTDNFNQRMYSLEQNGYFNVTGLKRKFAIEVENYDEKETLLHEIFSKSRIANSELFALDEHLVIQLLSSFEGKQIYPERVSKKESFSEATEEVTIEKEKNQEGIPYGIYTLSRKMRKGDFVKQAKLKVIGKQYILLRGSHCFGEKFKPKYLQSIRVKNNILQEDIVCPSVSTAACIVTGTRENGWMDWKDKKGQPIDKYRNKGA